MTNHAKSAAEQATPNDTPRRKPSRGWYLFALLLLVGSTGVFVYAVLDKAAYLDRQIEPMPRFVAPTDEQSAVVEVVLPGKQNIFYENLGSLAGRSFDTPRRQVWTTYESPSMLCSVTRLDTGEAVDVRLPGMDDPESLSRTSEDQVITYDIAGRQGHSAWVFDADAPGRYRISLRYKDAVSKKVSDFEIPPELTRDDKKQMRQADGDAYQLERRAVIEQVALASLEPIDVLFAVGPDPTRGSFFQVIGLKGAAGVLAFGFTASTMIALLTLMLRGGHVTPRGELAQARRGLPGLESNQ